MIAAEIQKAVFDAITGAGDVTVYDNPPEKPIFPYVAIGDEQVIDDGTTCSEGWEVYTDVVVYDRPQARSKARVKTLAARVVTAVVGISTISGFRLIDVKLDTSRTERDADGVTEVTTLTFRFLIQED